MNKSCLFFCFVLLPVLIMSEDTYGQRRATRKPERKVDTVLNCQPITLTGFNYDVVANGVTNDPKSTVTISPVNGLDNVGYVFTSEDFNYYGYRPAYFLPSDRILKSTKTSGLFFKLAEYSTFNALLLCDESERPLFGKGTLTFGNVVMGKALFILGTTGSGNADVNFVINYDDGTKEKSEPEQIPDWFNSTGEVIVGERFSIEENRFYVIYDNPGFSCVTLPINPGKRVKSIDANTNGNGFCAIMAISVGQ